MSGKLALIIATSQYQDPALRQLVTPAQDAESLARVLKDPAIGGFQVWTLINEPSYKVNLEIESFCDHHNRDDLLLVYFSYHGIKDADGLLYFATVDTQLARHNVRRATAVGAEFVNQVMSRGRSRHQILLLDCCYSGAFKAGMLAKGSDRVGAGEQLQGQGRIVLTASDALQYSFEGEQVQGEGARSIFTRELVRGLETGDADLDRDGSYSLDEVYDYVYSRVSEERPEQKPMKMGYVEGKIFIGNNPRPRPAKLPPEVQDSVEDRRPWVRLSAVQELERLLAAQSKGVALGARNALTTLAEQDDSLQVRTAAEKCLGVHIEMDRGPEGREEDEAAAQQAGWEEERLHAPKADAKAKLKEEVTVEPEETLHFWFVRLKELIGSFLTRALRHRRALILVGLVGVILICAILTSVRYFTRQFVLARTLTDTTGTAVTALAFSADEKILASQSEGKVKLWSLDTYVEIDTLETPGAWIWSAAFSPDGKTIVTGGSNGVTFWDLSTGRQLRRLASDQNVRSLAFSSDGKRLATGGSNNGRNQGSSIRLWDVSTVTILNTITSLRLVNFVAFSPDDRSLLTVGATGETSSGGGLMAVAQLWDVATGKEIRRVGQSDFWPLAVAFSPNGRWLALGGTWRADSTYSAAIKVLGADSAQELAVIPSSCVQAMAFGPTSQWFVCGGGELEIHSAPSGRDVQVVGNAPAGTEVVAISTHGHWLASGTQNGTTQLWRSTR
jgi:hypothetical protein